MSKKSIVLSGNNNKKAVLSLEEEGEDLKGRLRLYNFKSEPSGIISLGLYSNGKVVKAGLTKSSSMLYSFTSLNCSLPDSFSCAVVNFFGGESEPILYGSSEGEVNAEEVFGAVINSLQEVKTAQEVENVLDEHGIEYDEELQKEIDNAIEDEIEGHNCSKCKYREYFYANCKARSFQEGNESHGAIEPEIDDKQESEEIKNPSFFNEIEPQISNLFDKNPPEEYLQQMFPNSKWVKVEFEEGGDYYVFGMMYEEGKLKYLCYGVPGIYQKNPPKQLSGYPVWFPLDQSHKEGFGYWLTYQDAESGESVKAIVE